MIVGELDASLLTVILPMAAPLKEGANVDVIVVDFPGDKISPLAAVELNPAPATITCEIVTLELPVFVRVTFWVPLLATVTVPKSNRLELELRRRLAAAETVSKAGLLVTLPLALLTTTVNCAALSEAAAAVVV